MNGFEKQFRRCRSVGVPVVAVETPDQFAAIRELSGSLDTALFQWDVARGVTGLSDSGSALFQQMAGDARPENFVGPAGLVELLGLLTRPRLLKTLEGSVIYVLNAHRFLEDIVVVQALGNVRDVLKAQGGILVLLGPRFSIPIELQGDIVVLTEPLPGEDRITAIVREQHKNANLAQPDAAGTQAAVDALLGLAAFSAEQAVALSLTRDGLDQAALWERKRQMIENTPGLAVWRGGETFDDVGGLESIKKFLTQVMEGRNAPRAIVFIDEIEKAMSGASGPGGDTSGVSQDYLGALLSYMQDNQATGCIFVGPPGAAKSLVAKAAGASAGIPTIKFDMGSMKGSLVGQSEANIRRALQVVSAVSGGRALFIATCNSLAILPPELRRRFTFGIYFFDLPDDEERAAIWRYYIQKFKLDETGYAKDQGWTGAEIRQCCDLAWRLNSSLEEAAAYIVPVSKSAAEAVENLRVQASNRFISASYAGTYRRDRIGQELVAPSRRLELQD